MSKLRTILDGVRTKAGEVYAKYAYYLPRRKVIAATIGAAAAQAVKEVFGLDLDPTLAGVIGAGVLGYLVPEKPDVAISVVHVDPEPEQEDPASYPGGAEALPDFRPDVEVPRDDPEPPGRIT